MSPTWNWKNSWSEPPGGNDVGSPECPHRTPSLVSAFLQMETHTPRSSPHSPPMAGPGLTLVTTRCALGPQGLTLASPLPCSLQEQLTSKAGLYLPAFPGQGPLTSALHLLTSLSSVLCLFFYKLNKLLWVTLCQSFYFKIKSLAKAGGELID